MFYRLALFLALGFCFWKWINFTCSLDPNHDCNIGTEKTSGNISHFLAYSRKLGNRRSSEGLQSFKPSKGTNLLTLIILAGDIEMNPGPRFLCRLCKNTVKLPTNLSHAMTAKSAFMRHVQIPAKKKFPVWKMKMNLGIVQTAKQTVVFAVGLS